MLYCVFVSWTKSNLLFYRQDVNKKIFIHYGNNIFNFVNLSIHAASYSSMHSHHETDDKCIMDVNFNTNVHNYACMLTHKYM